MRKNITEEYLETILYLTRGGARAKTRDIAQAMGIKPPSVSEMLLKLRDQGYIDYMPYEGAALTEEGRAEAIRMERKHQLLETFLVGTLGVDTDTAHDEACELEHSVSDNTMERICSYLGHPRYCPDDHPITKGECCEKADSVSMPLLELNEGEEGVIRVITLDNNTRDYMLSLGFLPDVPVYVKKKLPSNSLLVRIKGSEIAIGRDIACKILVSKTAPKVIP
ncbi:metal-dependent transcriptional regulator [Methanocella arvoryzae]|uniref:Fe-dependent transcription repressor (FeoA family) n=1 Tax=Methanocella arvoryzae (strain DSM 22066 / NBRC 105507 / MRE50) TaxID=351160 RepID=Q0W4R0_METAR|nr:metal-dependent transcriptional regulator [Methanocella arvoryzae]CAJ36633.1 Fe-dependent transcription repressor (FeoA family) [Methanocella arvoryzae MRE50]